MFTNNSSFRMSLMVEMVGNGKAAKSVKGSGEEEQEGYVTGEVFPMIQ